MRRKPRLLLLDAGAVIGAFACEGWDQLCKSYHIVVPTIVIGEARFYHDSVGNQRPIGLDHHIESGLIERFEASATELATTIALLHPYIRDRLHAGELEALTYLRLLEEKSGIGFISADGAAIQATYAFDAARCALSSRGTETLWHHQGSRAEILRGVRSETSGGRREVVGPRPPPRRLLGPRSRSGSDPTNQRIGTTFPYALQPCHPPAGKIFPRAVL